MDEQKIARHVAGLVQSCKQYLDEQESERTDAQEYYNGEMNDLPVGEGRSSVVDMSVRSTIKKIMPSITRTILSNDNIVEYEPVGPEDEEGAEQATEYVNLVVVPECDAERAIYDAIHDACLVKTGILKWTAYTYRKAIVQDYTDLRDEEVLGLIDDDENEVFDYTVSEETDPEVLAVDPNARRHSFKVKRITDDVQIKLEAIPRESFLITPGAESIEDAELTGEIITTSRSDLVSMGYDREKVRGLDAYSRTDEEGKDAREGDDATDIDVQTREESEIVLVYEVYVKIDADDDGIAECHRLVFGDAKGEDGKRIVLGHEVVSEAPYADIVIERDPHQFEGHSIYEDVRDVQRVKTALLRGTLDNIYAQNNPRPVVDYDGVQNPDAVLNAKWGEPIIMQAGRSAQDVIRWETVPFMAQHSFPMLEYFDNVAKDRTGITDASGGVDPEAFQNTSATAAHLMSESGIAQADAVIRSISRGGLRKAFRGLLKLVVAHSDGPRTVRLRGEWKTYDPATWNVDMDATINVGLGGGSRERDLATLQIVLGLQRELLATIGPDNPYVKPEQLYNTLAKITETAGFPSADPFFTEPNPEEIAAKLQAQASKPSPEEQKLQMQMQVENAKMQANRDKERAQMEADLQVKRADIEAKSIENAEKFAIEREKIASQERIGLAKIEADLIKERERAQREAEAPVPDILPGGLQ